MTKTYKDQQGNKYRRAGGGWEIMRKGIGWQAFESTAYMTVISEDGAMQTIPAVEQPEPPEAAEERQVRKIREDELFVHIAVEQMDFAARTVSDLDRRTFMDVCKENELNENTTHTLIAHVACDYAQAMIDELKKRGKI